MLHSAFLTEPVEDAAEWSVEEHPFDHVDDPIAPHDGSAGAAPTGKRKRQQPSNVSQEVKKTRQAFAKRKRTIVDKALQLSQTADAKVFCFFVNGEGAAWAYATPNFQAGLRRPCLDALQQAAGAAAWERVRVMPQPGREEVVPDDDPTALQDAPPHLVSPTEDGAAGGGVALQHAVPGLQVALQQPSMQGIGGGGAAAGLAIAGQRLEPG